MVATESGRLIDRFWTARRHPELAVLEGFHPLKHALRFGATIKEALTADLDQLLRLCESLAPDLKDQVADAVTVIDGKLFTKLSPRPPETKVIAIARRHLVTATSLLQAKRTEPLVLLERPSHLGNVGAVIRVAAAAGASGVITSGIHDPWGPDAVRGAAGLQYAIPVARSQTIDEWFHARGPLLAIHPEGEQLTPDLLPADALIAFGSERSGLSDELLRKADGRFAIPMQPGVSSLNLATSVAITLYSRRLNQ